MQKGFAEKIAANYDIAANDEPNGHGTVTYKPKVLEEMLEGPLSGIHSQKLLAFLKLTNMVVGDALANTLMLEAIMYDRDMTVQDFNDIYHENPSKMYMFKCNDKSNFQMTFDESRLT